MFPMKGVGFGVFWSVQNYCFDGQDVKYDLDMPPPYLFLKSKSHGHEAEKVVHRRWRSTEKRKKDLS